MKQKVVLREIRESSGEELKNRLGRLEGELFRLRLRRYTNQLENLMQIRSTRREIARVMTIMSEQAKKAKTAVPGPSAKE